MAASPSQDDFTDGRAPRAAVGRPGLEASEFRVPFVGLTGGLGSGKSTALAALERLGAAVLSTDAVVHELYRSDEVRDAVVERWGPEMVVDGEVSRPAVAPHVFWAPDERAGVEGLLGAPVGHGGWGGG